jgi:hypothetical protein
VKEPYNVGGRNKALIVKKEDLIKEKKKMEPNSSSNLANRWKR